MASWSFFTGATRVGQPPAPSPGVRLSGAADAFAAARATAWVGGVLFALAAGGLIAWLLDGSVSGDRLALVGIAPAAAIGFILLAVAHPGRAATRRALLGSSWAFLSLALVLAVAGHLLHPRGAPMQPWFPPFLGSTLDMPIIGLLLSILIVIAVPLLAGARIHLVARGVDETGARATAWRLALHMPPTAIAWRFLEGARLPGLVLADITLTLIQRIEARIRHIAMERLHADVDEEALVRALEAADADVTPTPTGYRIVLPAVTGTPSSDEVELRFRRHVFPQVRADSVLDLEGPGDEVWRLRNLLENDASHALVSTWSAPARRMERQLNVLLMEARDAESLEERSILLEEADRMARIVDRRRFAADERLVLAAKLARLRHGLQSALLHQSGAPRKPDRSRAPAPALAPDLSHLLRAGGLDRMRDVTYAPRWIIPISTPLGERDAVVDPATGREAVHADALLRVLGERAPSPFVDVARHAQFPPAPPPTAAILRAFRDALPRGSRLEPAALAAPVELIYVPSVPMDDGVLDAATGERIVTPAA